MAIGGERLCRGCGTVRGHAEFAFRNAATETRHLRCRICCRETSRRHYQQKRAAYLERSRRNTPRLRELSQSAVCGFLGMGGRLVRQTRGPRVNHRSSGKGGGHQRSRAAKAVHASMRKSSSDSTWRTTARFRERLATLDQDAGPHPGPVGTALGGPGVVGASKQFADLNFQVDSATANHAARFRGGWRRPSDVDRILAQ